ncbi:MAG: hypothetical protein IJR93_12635 [Treponema sp.]|nr:hypothetical protein [Treponema sp.]
MKRTRFVAVLCIVLVSAFAVMPLSAADKATEEVIDWNGRLEGEEQVPVWLRTLRRGNAVNYCQEMGLMSKINREWMVPTGSESYVGWEDGLVAARATGFMAVGQTIATQISSSIGSSLSDGAKSNIQRIALTSVTTITGLQFEGYHWYEVVKEVVTGQDRNGKPMTSKQHVWYVYAFYSMDRQTYNTLLKLALQKICRDSGFTKEEATLIATRGLEILDERYRAKEDFQQKIANEQQEMRLAWQRQQMGIQQSFVNQQLDHGDRVMTMAEQNQRNQNDLANRNASNLYNQQTMGKVNSNQIANRNVDTQQQQIQSTTEQLQSRDNAVQEMARANAASNATQAVENSAILAEAAAQTGSNQTPASVGYEETTIMNDPLALLMGL